MRNFCCHFGHYLLIYHYNRKWGQELLALFLHSTPVGCRSRSRFMLGMQIYVVLSSNFLLLFSAPSDRPRTVKDFGEFNYECCRGCRVDSFASSTTFRYILKRWAKKGRTCNILWSTTKLGRDERGSIAGIILNSLNHQIELKTKWWLRFRKSKLHSSIFDERIHLQLSKVPRRSERTFPTKQSWKCIFAWSTNWIVSSSLHFMSASILFLLHFVTKHLKSLGRRKIWEMKFPAFFSSCDAKDILFRFMGDDFNLCKTAFEGGEHQVVSQRQEEGEKCLFKLNGTFFCTQDFPNISSTRAQFIFGQWISRERKTN